MSNVKGALEDADVALLIADSNDNFQEVDEVFQQLRLKVPSILVLNKIDEAANGKIALQVLETQHPELIVLDLMMPEMDGFEFLSRIREKEAYRKIPVIVVTAKQLTREDHMRLNGSVQKVLQKGFQT